MINKWDTSYRFINQTNKCKHTYAHCCKNVFQTVHVFGTVVNNMNIKQVKTKKKLLGKIFACKLGTILQFWLSSKAETLLCMQVI